MALKIGSKAPDFKLPGTEGEVVHFYEDIKQTCILYFYPKDFTPGCTAEACGFRDDFAFFKENGIPILGISKDSIETHQKFTKSYKLPFQLLSDTSGMVISSYKAMFPIINMPRRITYLADTNKTIIEVFDNLLMAKDHISKMKKALEKA
jgi:peroxiredoxin Q/BCP